MRPANQRYKLVMAKNSNSFDSIEVFLRRLSDAEKSLKSLEISLKINWAIEVQPSLIEALATHPELEEVKIMGTLRCQTV